MLYIRKGVSRPAEEEASTIPAEEKALLERFKQACRDGDAPLARRLLGTWVRRFGPGAAHGSVMEFARMVDEEALRNEIYRFDAVSFSRAAEAAWQGGDLWKQFNAWQKSRHQPPAGEMTEPDLYAQAR